MGDATISRSAQGVLLIRAELTSLGVIDDPYARQMLPANGRRVLRAFAWPGMWRVARLSTTPSLAVRTIFFDGFVRDAIAAGIRQVVVLAAGYDSRAWRLAQPGVAFFEVDRAATQADKRGRAPTGGPGFVAADVTDERLVELLAAAGVRADEPVAFVVEGLVVYLEPAGVAHLFTRLAAFSAPRSRIAISFDSGFSNKPLMRRVMTAYYRGRERFRFRLAADEIPAYLTATGWTVTEQVTPADLAPATLAGTRLAGVVVDNPSNLVVAERTTA
jgi:methyltransferase (TIGR00027 family)